MIGCLDEWLIGGLVAKVVKSEEEGTIKSIFIDSKSELTILNEDGKEVKYYISKDSAIRIDRETSNIYGLRLGYYVVVDIEGSEIVYIDAEMREQNDRYTGNIQYINTKAGVITISVTNSTTGEKEPVRVDITEDTSFIDANTGSSLRFSSLSEGDEVIVTGSFDGGIFTAKTIIITLKR